MASTLFALSGCLNELVTPTGEAGLSSVSVTAISPSVGTVAGGTFVTITGTGLDSKSTVSFGDSAATTCSLTETQLICVTPAHAAGSVTVKVTNSDGQSGTLDSFTYRTTSDSAPGLSLVLPSAGSLGGGTSITLTGTGFQSGATVTFDTSSATSVVVNSSTQITCVTPAHGAGTVKLTVTNPDTQQGTLTGGYTYQPAPTVTAISPSGGALAGGTNVTLTGTNFRSSATVKIGTVTCTSPNVVSSTSMTCSTGAHAAGAVTVTATNSDNQQGSLSNGYTYQAAPTVSSVSPTGGSINGGTSLNVNGTGFLSGMTVSVGGVTCGSVSVVTDTLATCTTSGHSAATVNVVATNSDGQSGTKTNGYTYQPAPTVTSVSPSSGSSAGGTSVTITGTGFVANATVAFDGVTCSSPSVTSSTTVTCTTGAHAASAVNAVVTNSDAQYGTGSSVYTYTSSGSGTWSSTSTSSAPSGTRYHAATWTGSEMVVWGGSDATTTYDTGARYDPTADSWSAMTTAGAPYARFGPTAVWTGSRVIIWGGIGSGAPTSNLEAVWQYDPSANSWSSTNPSGVPQWRDRHIAVWTGSKMVVWGGTYSGCEASGGIYNPSNDTWTATNTLNAPTGRCERFTGIWTGSKMIVWGGDSAPVSATFHNTGGVFDPNSNTWTATTTSGAPSARSYHSAVWTGSKMIIWGGTGGGVVKNDGYSYDPSNDSWSSALSSSNAPGARIYHTAVWTGSVMIIFGGYTNDYTNTGGIYNPTSDSWTSVSSSNVPAVRSDHSAVWTGSKMIVWGGFNNPSGTLTYIRTGGRFTPP